MRELEKYQPDIPPLIVLSRDKVFLSAVFSKMTIARLLRHKSTPPRSEMSHALSRCYFHDGSRSRAETRVCVCVCMRAGCVPSTNGLEICTVLLLKPHSLPRLFALIKPQSEYQFFYLS